MRRISAPSDFTIQKVKNKYECAIRLLEDYQRKQNSGTVSPESRVLADDVNSAGLSLSDAIEYAMKFHMQENWAILNLDQQKLYWDFNIPKAIQSLYSDVSADNARGILFDRTHPVTSIIPDEIDFSIIKNRTAYSNDTHHKGNDLLEVNVNKVRREIEKFINCYLDPAPLKTEEDFRTYPEAPVNLYHEADGFQGQDTVYVLINDNGVASQRDYEALSRIDWRLILDFDPDTFKESNLGTIYGKENLIHLFEPKDFPSHKSNKNLTTTSYNPIYFLLNGNNESTSVPNYSKWVRTEKSRLDHFLENFFISIVNEGTQQVFVVSLKRGENYNKGLVESLLSKLPSNVSLRYISFDDDCKSFENDFEDEFTIAKCQISDLAEVLEIQLKERVQSDASSTYKLPYRKDDPSVKGFLIQQDFNSYSRFMEILILNGEYNSKSLTKRDFFQGSDKCPWYGIENKWPVESSKQSKAIIDAIKSWVEHGERIGGISHQAGMGGTTIARIVSWRLHETYPVVWIHTKDMSTLPNIFENLYDKVKWPILAFVEIPQVMEFDEMTRLSNSINPTKNILFIGVGRNRSFNTKNIYPLIDWGNNMSILVDSYCSFLDEMNYSHEVYSSKSKELNRLRTDAKREEKCPFVVGLTTFDKDYKGIEGYVANFKSQIGQNPALTDALCLLAFCDKYGRPLLPSQFFRSIFHPDSSRPFSLAEPFQKTGIVGTLIREEQNENRLSLWRLINPALTKQVLKCFAELSDDESNIQEVIYHLAQKFIQKCGETARPEGEMIEGYNYYEELLSHLFIGRPNPHEEKYSPLMNDLSDQQKIFVFELLHQTFPENPHFCSHLARCYAKIDKNLDKALEKASLAIDLSDGTDPVLFHMRAECYRNILSDRIDKAKDWDELNNPQNGITISQYVENASIDYRKTIDLQHQCDHITEHSYSGHIRLLLSAINSAKKLSGLELKKLLTKEPFCAWWAEAQTLVEEFDCERDLISSDDEANLNSNITRCKADLYQVIDDYSSAIQIINNELSKNKSPQIRRMAALFQIHQQDSRKNYKNNGSTNIKLLEMLETNLSEDFSLKDFYPWFEVARYSNLLIKDVIDKINTWRNSAKAVIPVLEFYRFVLNTILAYEGSTPAVIEAAKALTECKRLRPNCVKVQERIGCPTDRQRMKGAIVAGRDTSDKYDAFHGKVTDYYNKGRAFIGINGWDEKLKIFFNPLNNRLNDTCLNQEVEFRLEFSYDGLSAMQVTFKDTGNK